MKLAAMVENMEKQIADLEKTKHDLLRQMEANVKKTGPFTGLSDGDILRCRTQKEKGHFPFLARYDYRSNELNDLTDDKGRTFTSTSDFAKWVLGTPTANGPLHCEVYRRNENGDWVWIKYSEIKFIHTQ